MTDDHTPHRTQSCVRGCFVVFVVFFILSVLDVVPLTGLAIKLEERARTLAVGKDIPSMFPILVLSRPKSDKRYRAAIVFHESLASYLNNHPDHSFKVPLSQAGGFNEQLKKYSYHSSLGVGRFSVTELSNGKQRLKVEGTRDDDIVNIGWYDADSSTFTAIKYVRYFGPGLALMYLPIVILFNFLLSIGVCAAYRFAVRRRAQQAHQEH
ncbi:MAG: hypothetical protein M1133_13695 [Armatimonadetes bacterium]|nr:hypothetical protein [Armatimonadota bacterium]